MFEFLSNNYTWVFSGIGVFFISLLVYYKRSHPLKTFNKVKKNQINVIDSDKTSIQLIDQQINYNAANSENKGSGTINFLNLDANKIMKEINDSPPFQREQIASNFYGIKISWKVTFNSIHPPNNNISRVMSRYKGNYPWIYFSINLEDYPVFKIIKEGKTFLIVGKILEYGSGGFTIDVEKIEII